MKGKSRRKQYGIALAVFGLLSCVVACQLLVGLGPPSTDPFPSEAGPPAVDSGFNPGFDAGDPCHHVGVAPMGPDDDPALELPPMVFVMHTTHLTGHTDFDASLTGNPNYFSTFGFDLDNACTCQPGWRDGAPCTSTRTQCDFDGGIDDSVSGFYVQAMGFGNVDTLANINYRIASGDISLMFTISRYNGRANDQDVTISFAAVTRPGANPADNCDGGQRPFNDPNFPEAGLFDPAWDGCDVWGVTRDLGPANGYVVNHVLVIPQVATIPFPLGTSSVDIKGIVSQGVLLPHSDGTYSLEDVVLAGRVIANDMLAALATFHVTTNEPGPACDYPNDVLALQSFFCPARDTMGSASEDFHGLACDSVSMTFSYRADPAVRGDAGASTALDLESCADSGAVLTCPNGL